MIRKSVKRFSEKIMPKTKGVNQQQKKAARLPERPFLSHGSPTLEGDLRLSSTGGLSPGNILIGCRCASGQSRFCLPNLRDGFPSP